MKLAYLLLPVLFLSFVQQVNAQVSESDSLALVAIYNDMNGSFWTNTQNNDQPWLEGSVSTWYGITVEDGRVTALDLSDNDLQRFTSSGEILTELPEEFGQLTALQSLNISANFLFRLEFPSSLSNLEQLTFLDFSNCFFSDSISFVENLDLAEGSFNLSLNALEGSLDFLATVDGINDLDLSSNNFEDLPDLRNVPFITSLNVSNNEMDFEDFEPNGGLSGITFGSQSRFSSPFTKVYNSGEPFELSLELNGTANTYQWSKDDEAISGATTNPLSLSGTSDDAGFYSLSVTNDLVSGVTLESNIIYVVEKPFEPQIDEFLDPIYAFTDLKNMELSSNNNFQMSANLGDLNNDEIDDFGILYQDRLLIYFGGTLTQNSDVIIEPESDFYLTSVRSGDFNGDGFSDIMTLEQNNTLGGGSLIKIYFGSTDLDLNNDLLIDSQDIDGVDDIGLVQQIGDIDDDGATDFVFLNESNPVIHLYFGGESLSGTPDLYLSDFDFSVEGMEIFSSSFLGFRADALGDINGDGISDFAVSDQLRNYTFSNSSERGAGVIYVYYGREDRTFGAPDQFLMLPESFLEQTNSLGLFGFNMEAGDFNGDGQNDLTATPAFCDNDDIALGLTEGQEGIFIYYGGADFDNIPDVSLKILSEPFEVENQLFRDDFVSELISIPDLNNDGNDEFLFTSLDGTNAALSQSDGDISEDELFTKILHAVDRSSRLGINANITTRQLESAVGDFNNDGAVEVILPQDFREDNTDPVYIYALNNTNPEIADQNFEIESNSPGGTLVGTVIASDPQGSDLTYNIIEETSVFEINGATGELNVSENATLELFSDQTLTLTIEVTDNGGLSSSASVSIFVNRVLATGDEVDRITVYPNPATESVIIQSFDFNVEHIEIFNLSGKMVDSFSPKSTANKLELDVSMLPSDMYLLILKGPDWSETHRLIKR